MRTILVVEDEPQIAGLVRDYLEHAGFAVITAGDGAAALALVRARRPDALVLDLGLPRVDGLDVIRAIRRDSRVPILILSARGDETDRVAGLELGADDYVVKPFSPRELVARVRAVLRRAEAVPLADERIVAGDLALDLVRRRVTVAGRDVTLTPTEFELLATLAREPGRVWTRSQLLDAVHGFSLETLRAGHRRPHPQPAPEAGAGRDVAALRPHGARRGLCPGGAGRVSDHGAPQGGPSRWQGRRRHGRGRGAGRRRRDGRLHGAWASSCWWAWSRRSRRGSRHRSSASSRLRRRRRPSPRSPSWWSSCWRSWPGIRVFGSAVRPLGEIASATDRLADGEPGVRVRVRGPRPVRGLAASFNTMAERLDRSRDERRAMLADVTHELRTPITVVQGGLEAMLDGVHPYDEDHVAPLLAETAVMGRLLDDLRTLSLADVGALTLHREPADLAGLTREVTAVQGAIAAAKGVEPHGDR